MQEVSVAGESSQVDHAITSDFLEDHTAATPSPSMHRGVFSFVALLEACCVAVSRKGTSAEQDSMHRLQCKAEADLALQISPSEGCCGPIQHYQAFASTAQ